MQVLEGVGPGLLEGAPAAAEPEVSVEQNSTEVFHAAMARKALKSDRDFMKAGTWYQNEVGSLLNREGGPISVTLRITSEDKFELKVENLSSPSGDSAGWIRVASSFNLRALPDRQDRVAVAPAGMDGGESFSYEPDLLTPLTVVAMRALEKTGGAGLAALNLEVDTAEDSVLVVPASVLRLVWRDAVVLSRRREEELWRGDAEIAAAPASEKRALELGANSAPDSKAERRTQRPLDSDDIV